MCVIVSKWLKNEGVEFDGEAGVFPSLLPDNAPSGEGGAAATDALPMLHRR